MSLTATEVFLRSYEAWQHEQQQLPPEKLSLFEPNPEGTGSYRLKPNLDLVTSVADSEVKIHTNSHGMPLARSIGRAIREKAHCFFWRLLYVWV